MHILFTFWQGLAFGFTMAAIPGPITFLIVQRTLAEGPLTGFCCALGAITADFIYALVAAIGLTFVMQFLMSYQVALAMLGGLFIIYLGLRTFFRNITIQTVTVTDTRLFTAWLSTMLLTLANPVTIVSYCVIFAGLGIDTSNSVHAIISLLCGVILGALVVEVTLIGALSVFRKKVSQPFLRYISKGAGIVLVGFGIAALIRGVQIWYQGTC